MLKNNKILRELSNTIYVYLSVICICYKTLKLINRNTLIVHTFISSYALSQNNPR